MNNFQKSFKALGSDAILTLVLESESEAEATFESLQQQIDSFEQRFSRFIPSSELTKVNQNAGTNVPVGHDFLRLLKTSIEMSRKTDGLYNPFILPQLQKAGYRGSWPNPDSSDKALDFDDRSMSSVEEIEMGNDWAKIPATSALDFGGIGKGYLLDELVRSTPGGVQGFWLALGGDIVMSGLDMNGMAWDISIQHAIETDQRVGSLANSDDKIAAVATSGITKRKGEKEGTKWHHIIDPLTGKPVDTDILTVSVLCGSGVDADVYAKCAVILGSVKAWGWLEDHGVMRAIMQKYGNKGELEIIHKEASAN